MEVKTFTSFWNQERKLYAIYDIAMPFPVSLRVVGVFFLVAAPWWGMLKLFQVPFGNPIYLIWVLPPVGLAYLATKPIFQGKTIFQYMKSMASFLLLEPKHLVGMKKITYETDRTYTVAPRVFTRDEKLTVLDKPERKRIAP